MKLFALTLLMFPMIATAALRPYPSAGTSSATYEVPTDDDSLKPFASFPITDTRVEEKGSGVTIRYTLPLELTGVDNEIVIAATNKKTDGSYTVFKGPNAQANCNETACNVRYRNLNIDADAARTVMIKNGVGSTELSARMDIVKQFSGDPAGIIHFKRIERLGRN